MMASIAMIFGLAPAVAPIVGGWILGWTNWRGIFWFLVIWAALMIAATAPEPIGPSGGVHSHRDRSWPAWAASGGTQTDAASP